MRITELPEWSIIYKMLFDVEELDIYTKKHTVFNEAAIDYMPIEVIEQAAKFQVEYYFGQTSYYKDTYLQAAANKDGWINLRVIYKFNKIKKFWRRLSIEALARVMKLSTVVDIGYIDAFGDGQQIEYYIKKKKLELKSDYKDFFGYDVETIKQLSLPQFKIFL